MKNKKDSIILLVCLIIYILNQFFLKKLGILFFNNYLNDLIAVPLYFSLLNIISFYFRKKEITSFKVMFLITIGLAFLGEYVAIFLRKGSVTDYLDIACYFIGMVIYYELKNFKMYNRVCD